MRRRTSAFDGVVMTHHGEAGVLPSICRTAVGRSGLSTAFFAFVSIARARLLPPLGDDDPGMLVVPDAARAGVGQPPSQLGHARAHPLKGVLEARHGVPADRCN